MGLPKVCNVYMIYLNIHLCVCTDKLLSDCLVFGLSNRFFQVHFQTYIGLMESGFKQPNSKEYINVIIPLYRYVLQNYTIFLSFFTVLWYVHT